MTPNEVTNILHQFNEWQRGHNTVLRPSSSELGKAIDTAVEMLKLQEQIFDVIERTWYKQGLDICGASLSYFMTDVHSALEDSK